MREEETVEELLADLVARGWAVESEPIPTDGGEPLICSECEFEATSIENLVEHKRETPGH